MAQAESKRRSSGRRRFPWQVAAIAGFVAYVMMTFFQTVASWVGSDADSLAIDIVSAAVFGAALAGVLTITMSASRKDRVLALLGGAGAAVLVALATGRVF